MTDEQALALLDRYLCRTADESITPDSLTAYKLGTAMSMLCNLLELYEVASPDIVRKLFEKWRAELPSTETSPEEKPNG